MRSAMPDFRFPDRSFDCLATLAARTLPAAPVRLPALHACGEGA
jgi:hypothetical protein